MQNDCLVHCALQKQDIPGISGKNLRLQLSTQINTTDAVNFAKKLTVHTIYFVINLNNYWLIGKTEQSKRLCTTPLGHTGMKFLITKMIKK